MSILLILTGGTIDQIDDPSSPGSLTYDKTHINEMLDQARSRLDLKIDQLMLLNSEDITDNQLNEIISACQETDNTRIVITHGTNTMTHTAQRIAEKVKNKTVVLTGSMIPFKLPNSDALFNLGGALAAVQLLEPGVYIAMNGKIFTADNVEKDFERSEFISKSI